MVHSSNWTEATHKNIIHFQEMDQRTFSLSLISSQKNLAHHNEIHVSWLVVRENIIKAITKHNQVKTYQIESLLLKNDQLS